MISNQQIGIAEDQLARDKAVQDWMNKHRDGWPASPFALPMVNPPPGSLPALKPVEKTPDGLDQHALGAKVDAGKIRVSMVESQFARALEAVYQIGTDGAVKYTEGGWLFVENGFERYQDAGGRHRLARHKGEDFDKQSKSLHLAHEAWNALAVLELFLRDLDKARGWDKK